MKIVFLDEYSVCGLDLSRIKAMGEYIGYETTSPSEVLERAKDAGRADQYDKFLILDVDIYVVNGRYIAVVYLFNSF